MTDSGIRKGQAVRLVAKAGEGQKLSRVTGEIANLMFPDSMSGWHPA